MTVEISKITSQKNLDSILPKFENSQRHLNDLVTQIDQVIDNIWLELLIYKLKNYPETINKRQIDECMDLPKYSTEFIQYLFDQLHSWRDICPLKPSTTVFINLCCIPNVIEITQKEAHDALLNYVKALNDVRKVYENFKKNNSTPLISREINKNISKTFTFKSKMP